MSSRAMRMASCMLLARTRPPEVRTVIPVPSDSADTDRDVPQTCASRVNINFPFLLAYRPPRSRASAGSRPRARQSDETIVQQKPDGTTEDGGARAAAGD